MSKQDLQATWIFVKSLGYEKRETMHKNHFYIRAKEYSKDYCHSNNVREMCKFALNHYLSTQLGVHWRKIWPIVLGHSHDFEAEWHRQILQAIEYLKKLEKGETE